ncbi:MAG: 7TM diverse intracellular signaling domain-containing protein, partial [Candidatus Binatia bacterium]
MALSGAAVNKPGVLAMLAIVLSVVPVECLALDTVRLADSSDKYELGTGLEYLEDPGHRWTIADVSSPEFSDRFIAAGRRIPNLGITPSAFWARVSLQDTRTTPTEWVLEFPWPITDLVEFYVPSPSGYRTSRAGESVPSDEWPIDYHNPMFSIAPPADRPITYYLRVAGDDTIRLRLIAWSKEAFEAERAKTNFGFGFFYGILLVMALHNLLLYLSIKDRIYLYYVGTVASFALYHLTLNGIVQHYLSPHSVWLSMRSLHLSGAWLLLFSMIFSRNFLMTAEHLPTVDRCFRVMVWILVAASLWPLFGSLHIFQNAIVIPGSMAATGLVVSGIVSWRKGYTPARYYIIGWSLILLAALAHGLDGFGMNPTDLDPTRFMHTAFVLTVYTLSQGLGGRVKLLEQVARDADERGRLQQQELAHALRLSTLGEMSSALAHELNQPLSAIVNYVGACRRWLTADRRDEDKLQAAFEGIANEALRGGDIIHGILSFVRKRKPQRRMICINDVINDTLAVTAPEARRNGVNISLRLGKGLSPISADHTLIAQVLVNVIRNAFDAMSRTGPRARRITISSEMTHAGWVRVAVSDTGEGIDEELLPRIFEPFLTTREEGLGLGLAICKTIVDDHNGTIEVFRNAGPGMTFRISFPV